MSDQTYENAMKDAANAAWEQDWQKAASAYQQALQVSPNDPPALAGLGESLFQLQQYDQALQLYQRVSQLVTADPLPHEKIGLINEYQGNLPGAAEGYLNAAELYYARKDIQRAVSNWERAAQLNTDLSKAHMRLAVWYEQNSQTYPKAAAEYVEMGRLLQQAGETSKAQDALRRAQKVDPLNDLVRQALNDLGRGQPIQRTPQYDQPGVPPPQDVGQTMDEGFVEEEEGEKTRNPVEEAARIAMAVLADIIWDGQVPMQAIEPLATATELHNVGDLEGAIEAYTATFQAGFDHPALRFNLGILHQYAQNFRDAVNLLAHLDWDSEYGVAGRLALGSAYYSLGNLSDATVNMIEALKLADVELNPGTVDTAGYEELKSSVSGMASEKQEDIVKGASLYLDDDGWRAKIGAALDGYAKQGRTNYVKDLFNIMLEGGEPILAQIMERVDEYIARKMYDMASEEAHYAIQKSPDYLPAHRRIADIMITQNRIQDAAEKINLVAETYLMRGNDEQAADLYAEVIKIWPADISARQRVLDMLKDQNRPTETLEQYAGLGELYYRMMADPNSASKVFEEAIEYAESTQNKSEHYVTILRTLAEIESQRLNWRQAQSHYDRIMQIAPDDEKTTLSYISLNFQMGEADKAITALDNYLRTCIQSGHPEKLVPTMEDQVRRNPTVVPLRERLAQLYQRENRIPDAVVQLNEIGDAQIESGNYEAAIRTIKKIVAMNPPDVAQYAELLKQLESGGLG